MSDACLFCRIVGGAIPAALVASNDHAIAFRDLHPQAPSHVLVIPRRHVASLAEATDTAELHVKFTTSSKIETIRRVLAYGGRVILMKPESWRHEINAAAKALAQSH